ncbi:sulfur carrier protein ThiS adenylyltransferase ThiF [Pseudoflavonifractor sp. An85]|uniref:sulfur carrier protein ThiS adenylyltransferase ThiF n=1 Tax=Pseudoflavonifractor sp. An85 TaxID=1965661 RepID=UPI000B375C0B|nr:sulfur carrier protein ThiS adenylyltransferase ThiF [Pseudoflavonifractor sp. An85]OUN21441.1 thiamine biosynthesis protein ThiF [Pseudoflavonifractor sp. An85]
MTPTREEWLAALELRHGKELQEKITAAHVAVCGLGGLGSNIAILLARAGVGHLHLVDFDRVDLTNLNRQQYFVSQIGQYKTEALTQTLGEIAPYCMVTSHTTAVTEDNIPTLFAGDTYICEAFDAAKAKAMLVHGVLEHWPHAYLIASSGMAGLHSANTICTRRVTSRFYLCGDEVSDVEHGLGLIAPRVAVCAAHAAHMTLRLIAGQPSA